MIHVLAIGIGGALGSMLRYGASLWVHSWAGRGFPWGTLVVNVSGCLAMGMLFVLLSERVGDGGAIRSGVLIGLLGGFTTFSSFSIETFNLVAEGAWFKAALNAGASLVLCLAATWIGVVLGRQV